MKVNLKTESVQKNNGKETDYIPFLSDGLVHCKRSDNEPIVF